jgi:hypothetical protein
MTTNYAMNDTNVSRDDGGLDDDDDGIIYQVHVGGSESEYVEMTYAHIKLCGGLLLSLVDILNENDKDRGNEPGSVEKVYLSETPLTVDGVDAPLVYINDLKFVLEYASLCIEDNNSKNIDLGVPLYSEDEKSQKSEESDGLSYTPYVEVRPRCHLLYYHMNDKSKITTFEDKVMTLVVNRFKGSGYDMNNVCNLIASVNYLGSDGLFQLLCYFVCQVAKVTDHTRYFQ